MAHPGRDPRRGRAVLPRPRHPATVAQPRHHAGDRPAVRRPGTVGGDPSRASRSWCWRWPSTSSATPCATPSTRRETGDDQRACQDRHGDARGRAISRSRSRPRPAPCRRSTTSSLDLAAGEIVGDRRRVRLRQERDGDEPRRPAAGQRPRLRLGAAARHRAASVPGRPSLRRVRGREIAYIFQEPMTSLNPVLTVGRQIGEVLQVHERLSRRAGPGAGGRAAVAGRHPVRRASGSTTTRTSSPAACANA